MNVFRILYRGSLSSCNYSCSYCPFAKTTNSREELRRDASEVARFVEWVNDAQHTIGVFFTPWGEAIIHEYYRQALIRLSQMPHVQRVVMQTNLSCQLSDLVAADRSTLALWATYHPTQTSISRFIDRCQWLSKQGLRYSVGVVGLREHFDAITSLRNELPADVYVWVNSYKRKVDYYTESDLEFIRSVDPYFDINRHYYPSEGKACNAGATSFTVDGAGGVRRCHFIDNKLGNIYDSDIFQLLAPRSCTNETCGCHIGYVHRPAGKLDQLFGQNLLERIPEQWPEHDQNFI